MSTNYFKIYSSAPTSNINFIGGVQQRMLANLNGVQQMIQDGAAADATTNTIPFLLCVHANNLGYHIIVMEHRLAIKQVVFCPIVARVLHS